MIIKTCDVCKKEVDELHRLIDDYKTDKVADVCSDCLKKIDDLLERCMKAQQIQRDNFIRKFIKTITR